MDESQLPRLADELTAELVEIQRLKVDIDGAQVKVGDLEPDRFELRAVGSILHDFYNSFERVFQRIAKEIDRRTPVEAAWHRDLLDQMTHPVQGLRPPVIRSESAQLLDDYLSFRHVFRNIYGFQLEWSRIKPLLENAKAVLDTVTADLEKFVAFLRSYGNMP